MRHSDLQLLAADIQRSFIEARQHAQTSITSAYAAAGAYQAVGDMLLKAREMVPEGSLAAWVRNNVPSMDARTAQMMMRHAVKAHGKKPSDVHGVARLLIESEYKLTPNEEFVLDAVERVVMRVVRR